MADAEQGERLQRENAIMLSKLCADDEIARLRKLNDLLRREVAESDLDCIYCGLPKGDMAKCELGFPGCGRADDLMI